jgi:hypothetical protein
LIIGRQSPRKLRIAREFAKRRYVVAQAQRPRGGVSAIPMMRLRMQAECSRSSGPP